MACNTQWRCPYCCRILRRVKKDRFHCIFHNTFAVEADGRLRRTKYSRVAYPLSGDTLSDLSLGELNNSFLESIRHSRPLHPLLEDLAHTMPNKLHALFPEARGSEGGLFSSKGLAKKGNGVDSYRRRLLLRSGAGPGLLPLWICGGLPPRWLLLHVLSGLQGYRRGSYGGGYAQYEGKKQGHCNSSLLYVFYLA